MGICILICFMSAALVCFAKGKINAQNHAQRKWTRFFETGSIRRA